MVQYIGKVRKYLGLWLAVTKISLLLGMGSLVLKCIISILIYCV